MKPLIPYRTAPACRLKYVYGVERAKAAQRITSASFMQHQNYEEKKNDFGLYQAYSTNNSQRRAIY